LAANPPRELAIVFGEVPWAAANWGATRVGGLLENPSKLEG